MITFGFVKISLFAPLLKQLFWEPWIERNWDLKAQDVERQKNPNTQQAEAGVQGQLGLQGKNLSQYTKQKFLRSFFLPPTVSF